MTAVNHEPDGALLEVCVDTLSGLQSAIMAGADRIELCASLATGGLTPSCGFMTEAAQTCPLPVHALIRPRTGDFHYSSREIALMQKDIATAKEAGLAGVVIGATQQDGQLDVASLESLLQHAGGLDVTLHRAFDMAPDFTEALHHARALGIKRILTSGGAASAMAGLPMVQQLTEQAQGAITIMPGGGIDAGNVALFLKLGLREIHASCSSPAQLSEKLTKLGFALPSQRQTDAEKIRALKAAIRAY
ncbi:copper homeostasis protein CutC [uncultured Cohaesibacter sp.]|uniref:copper homeostasis protein CutC n=1 Tax=uncultured Cohaesibacter sp. TaxID=1002546 RepID=UPI0029C6D652|nr:copper homeostasis protein CutC [uncultured Cohaesibacter sp.]